MNRNFWCGKKVMITGHTGFKGTWLSLYLLQLGATVIGYSLPPTTSPNLFDITGLEEYMHSYFYDIRDIDTLIKVIVKESPDIVFHLAAQSLVRYSYNHPLETYTTNILGTANLLEALRQTNIARVAIIVTSDKCYENKEWLWGYREEDRFGGFDPYSSSKACAEIVTAAYRNSYFNQEKPSLLIASTRAGNVIGGGDWAEDRLIPDFLRAIEVKQPIIIRNPHATRPWQHVLEPLSGYMLLAEKLWQNGKDFTGGWNFGPEEDDIRTVEWIINRLVTLWNEDISIQIETKQQPHEAHALKLDISKARSKLQWKPKWSLDDSLQKITEWHKALRNHQDMKDFTLQQINSYHG